MRRARLLRVGAFLLAGLASSMLLTVPGTHGALIGRITNDTSTAATAVFPCTAAALAPGTAWLLDPLDEIAGTVARDRSGNNRDGSYQGGVTLGQPGPCAKDGARAVTLNGSSGFVGNAAQQSNPQTFSVQIWFKTTANGYARGGRLIGFGNATGTAQSGSYDRHLYLNNAGKVVFGVYPGSVKEVISSASYNDGQWHHVVGTLSSTSGATLGQRLYIDGQPAGAVTTVTSAQVYDGYWRMGWDNLAGWGSTPTSSYFAGSVAYGAVFTSALTPAQVASLYAARS